MADAHHFSGSNERLASPHRLYGRRHIASHALRRPLYALSDAGPVNRIIAVRIVYGDLVLKEVRCAKYADAAAGVVYDGGPAGVGLGEDAGGLWHPSAAGNDGHLPGH